MDLKVLFHNPEDLSDDEYLQLSKKIQYQALMPYYSSFFAGFSMYLYEMKIVKRSHDLKRIAAAALVGFVIGGYGSYKVKSTIQR